MVGVHEACQLYECQYLAKLQYSAPVPRLILADQPGLLRSPLMPCLRSVIYYCEACHLAVALLRARDKGSAELRGLMLDMLLPTDIQCYNGQVHCTHQLAMMLRKGSACAEALGT